jgi:hypothetical protein
MLLAFGAARPAGTGQPFRIEPGIIATMVALVVGAALFTVTSHRWMRALARRRGIGTETMPPSRDDGCF